MPRVRLVPRHLDEEARSRTTRLGAGLRPAAADDRELAVGDDGVVRQEHGRLHDRKAITSALYDRDVVARASASARPACPPASRPEEAIETLLERGYDACEIDFESGFWMDYPFAERLGELARENDVALSVHAPLFGFMGHLEASGRKFTSAVGALDRSAGIVAASGAELVVFHPGSCSDGAARTRSTRSSSSSACFASGSRQGARRAVRDRGDGPRARPRLGRRRRRDRRRVEWVRPVLDFAHMHATSDGAFLEPEPFREALELATTVLEPARRSTSTSRTSRSRTATRRSTSRTARASLRAEPLATRSPSFDRPATVISESPDEESSQAIRSVLVGSAGSELGDAAS